MAFPFSFFSICGTALGVSRIGGNTRVLPLGLSYRSTNIKVERVRLKPPTRRTQFVVFASDLISSILSPCSIAPVSRGI